MGFKKLHNAVQGWLPKDPICSLPIKAANVNRKFIDKKLLAGTVSVSLIILIFGLFTYEAFSQPISHGFGVGYPLRLEVDESLQSYVEIDSSGMSGHTEGTANGSISGWEILNGTVIWKGSSQDEVKSLENISFIVYTRIDDRTYVNGTLTHLYIGTHLVVTRNASSLPNNTIDRVDMTISKIGLDTPTYQYYVNCSTSVNKSELGDA